MVDAAGFAQNRASDSLVGDVANVGRIRFARGILSGEIAFARPWQYLVSIDGSGLYAQDKPALTVTDLALIAPIGGHAHLSVGRQKEGVTVQMMSPSRGIDFAERAAPVTVFVPTRNDGVRLWGSFPRVHGGWTIGAFNDWLFNDVPFRDNGGQIAARVFYAPRLSRDSTRAVHVAIDGRLSQSSDGSLRYTTRPEQNEAPNFIDTRAFTAGNGLTGDVELMLLRGDLTFIAELLPTRAARTPGTLGFIAYYASLSWRPFGEARPYDEETGTAGRVELGTHRFAWELAIRFSHTDLTSRDIDGGVLDLPTFSVGMYGPSATRVLLGYGFSALARSGRIGRAGLATLRLQWELR